MDIRRLISILAINFIFITLTTFNAEAETSESNYSKEIFFATCLASQNLDVFREQGKMWLEELRKNDQNNSKNFNHLFENSVQIISSLPIPYFSVTKNRYQEPDRFYTNPLFVCHRYVDLFADERSKNFSMYELLFKGIDAFYKKTLFL